MLIACACACCFYAIAQGTNAPPDPSSAASGTTTTSTTEQFLPAAKAAAQEAKEWMLTFGLDRVPILSELKIGSVHIWKLLASGIYIVLALFSSKVIDWLVTDRLKVWAARTETVLDDLLLQLLHGPIKVVSFVILLHVGLRLFRWPPWVEDYLSKGLRLVVAWSLTYMVLKGTDLLVEYWKTRVAAEEDRAINDQFLPLLRKSIKAFVVVVAILITSQNLGVNITSILASLSIGGLALGLAAQDTVANLFGAVAIFLDKPFRIGDRIQLDSIDGTVETIGLRSTRVRNLDGFLITIPNKTMGGASITNVTRRPRIKTVINVGITYDTPRPKIERALAILREVYGNHPMTSEVLVGFDKFLDSSLNLLVVHWWKSTDFPHYLAGLQEMNLQLKERFDAEGIPFAFPSRTVYLRQDSTWNIGHAAPVPNRSTELPQDPTTTPPGTASTTSPSGAGG